VIYIVLFALRKASKNRRKKAQKMAHLASFAPVSAQ
jgi:hypothetical protein